MSDDVVETRVAFDVDQGSVNEAKRAYASIEKAIGSTEKRATSASKSISSGLGSAGRLTRGLGVGGGRELQQLAMLSDSLGDVASGAKNAVKSIAGSGGLTKSMVAMGAAGVAAAAALVVVVIALKDMMEASAEQARGLEALVSSQRELNKEIAAGLTTEDAQKQIKDISKAREDEAEILNKLKEGMDDLEGSISPLGVTIAGQFFPSIKELNKQIAVSDSLVKGYGAKVKGLNEVIEDGSLAANDAKEASAKAAEELEKAEEEQAEAAEKAAAATKKLADVNREYSQDVADVATDLARSQADARASSAQASSAASADAAAESKKAVRAFHDARLEADIDFFEESKVNQRENMRALRDIIRDGTREQEDLLATRSFLAIDQNTKATKRAMEDVAIAAADEREERDIAAQEQLEEMRRDFQNEARERKIDARKRLQEIRRDLIEELRALQTASNRKLQDLQTSLNRELALLSEGATKKLELENEYWAQSIGIVQNAIGQIGTGPTTNIAGGNTTNVNTNINGSNMSKAATENMMLNLFKRVGVVN